jgi:hypothetical protein
MADIEKTGPIFYYSGKSTDKKIVSGVPKGSVLIETDTSKTYRFDGLEWAEQFNEPPSPSIPVATVATVAAAGTRVQLPSAAATKGVMVIAKPGNTGYIYVGSSTVSSTVYGAALAASGGVLLPVANANLLYIDASVSGEGVSYFVL